MLPLRAVGDSNGAGMGGEIERLALVAAIALFCLPLERLWPARARAAPSWQRYRTDLLHVVVGGAVIRAGTVLAISACLGVLPSAPVAARLPLWAQVPAILLLSDFAFYLAHRACHAVPLLWRFHRIHHSSPHLDWLAAYRVHPVDQILNATLIALPALMLGFSAQAVIIYGTVYHLHAILLHSNVRFGFGPLGRIVASPRFHHWHHAHHEAAIDRNFGGQLAIWDRLFGTALDRDRFPDSYGTDELPRESFLAHLVAPLLPRPKSWKT